MLAAIIGPEYGALAELLGRLRPLVQKRIPDPRQRADVFRRLIEAPLVDLLRAGEWGAAERRARALLDAWVGEESSCENTSGGEVR